VTDLSDEELLAALGVPIEAKRTSAHTLREERIIAGFEDIQRFVDEHKHSPQHGEDRDIFERLYAVRLERIRTLPECRLLLAPLDRQGLLEIPQAEDYAIAEDGDDESLLAELGVELSASGDDITELKHVRPRAEVRAAEEIANRIPCKDFVTFNPLFLRAQQELRTGRREARRFEKDASVALGEFFILGGQMCYVAEVGELFVTDYDRKDRRLRVIYDNGTESAILLRSFQRGLYKDEAGRRLTNPAAGPLFEGFSAEGDSESGTIYVLRSRSDHPKIAENRDLVHKIGVTGGKIESRLYNAKLDPTYLLADVDIVATYELFNIHRSKLETVIHRFFSPARLDLEINDRFGHPVRPQEWYLAPLTAIDEAVMKIKDGSITEFEYNPLTASINKRTT